MKRETLKLLCDAAHVRRPVVRATDLATGDESVIDGDGVEGALDLPDSALEAARAALRSGQSTVLDYGESGLFLHAFAPLPRLAIVGAAHIAQVLAPMATLAGFHVAVIDPRGAFAAKERFPGVELIAGWPDEVLGREPLDAASALVTLAHDAKIDDLALIAALRSDAFYVGALGSRKTHAKRLERLAAAGLPEQTLARIHAPVGLDLGGRQAAEIAVAILAEVVQARNGGGP